MLSRFDHPQVLLFDIGGVCVVSPFQAILDYEKGRGIPLGWINFSISASGPQGAWQKLERGEILLDAAFFRAFQSDLSDEKKWRQFYARTQKQPATAAAHQIPAVPAIDAEWLYWEMMRMSRELDPHMWPALQRLRRAADQSGGKLVLGALSNSYIFPPDHPYHDVTTPDGRRHRELRAIFDVFVSSAHVGMRKPAEDIYRYAITRLHEFAKYKGSAAGVRPQDVTFLDDIGVNLKTAKAVGMRTIRVELGRADKAVAELERITGLDLKDDQAKL